MNGQNISQPNEQTKLTMGERETGIQNKKADIRSIQHKNF